MPLNLSSGEMRSFVDFIEGNVGEPPPHGAGEWRSRVCLEGPHTPRWRSPIISRASFAGMLPR